MPPRKRPSAPANRVYKSRTPLHQSRFPEKKKVITYGKPTTRRPPKLAKQDTLTQMDYVKRQQMHEEDEEQKNLEVIEEEVAEPRRKRRKTTGDVDELLDEEYVVAKPKRTRAEKGRRKTEGDNISLTPQFQTQTFTQLKDWTLTRTPRTDQDEEELLEEQHPQVDDEEVEGQDDEEHVGDRSFDSAIFDVPSSSQLKYIPKPATAHNARHDSPGARGLTETAMGPPKTPRRAIALEIPSSESPATPASSHSRASPGRWPLQERSTNIPISFSHKLPKLEVKDTFESISESSPMTGITTTPTKRSSPPKSVRFILPDGVEEEEPQSPSTRLSTLPPPPQPRTYKITKLEISDSDAESDDEWGVEPFQENLIQGKDTSSTDMEPETCYGEIGEETQRVLSSPHLSSVVEDSQLKIDTRNQPPNANQIGSPTLTDIVEDSQNGELSNEATKTTQTSTVQHIQKVVMSSQTEEAAPNASEERTQFIESQRLATQHISAMAPRTLGSDVFVFMHSQQVSHILNGSKTHDIRNWAYPATTSRIWIYEPKPVEILKYMAVIGDAKQPGQLTDESGIGNAEFNAKTGKQWRAYEILELYALADPLTRSELIRKQWMTVIPPKFQRVPPVVLNSLMANLLPPIMTRKILMNEPSSSLTDTQEAAAQLLSTIQQFTQGPPSSPPVTRKHTDLEEISEERVPSSQHDLPNSAIGLHPSQASTVDLTQTQTPRHRISRDVILESPTRPVLSSTPMMLPSLTPRGPDQVYDSIVPYSIGSSQILTKSQMFPESYEDESVPGPPPFIADSDEEED